MSKLPRHIIAVVIAKQALKPVAAQKLAREVAAYLMTERRTAELDSILRDIQQYRADHGLVELNAISAHELNDQIRHDIRTDIKRLYAAAKEIIINEILDETVIGGVRIELANQQFDASIRSKLNRFKQLAVMEKG